MGLQITTQRTETPATAGRMVAEVRVCRTSDGELVAEGDPRAAFLAYPVGEPIAEADLAAYRKLTKPASRAKAAAKPADKAAAKPDDK